MIRSAHRSRLPGVLTLVMALAAGCRASEMDAQQRPVLRGTASVAGTVVDSIAGRGLDGATVQLLHEDGAARTVETDSLGRFRIPDVRPGRYLLGFLHPVLDDLGIETTPVDIVVARGAARRTDLAIPSPATLRRALCGEDAVRDSIALLVGHARRARDRAPLDSVIVTVQWPLRTRVGQRAAPNAGQRRVAASSAGWFVVCGAQTGDTVQFTASRRGAAMTRQTLVIPASGLLLHEALLSDAPSPVASAPPAARDSTTQASSIPDTHPVSGIVVEADGGTPIPDAIVAIPGGPSTRTDAQGTWRLTGVAAGSRTLTVRAVRYAPLRVPIAVAPRMTPVRLAMARLQGMLDTVNVVAEAGRDRNLAAFLERSRTRGSGTFLAEGDITSRRATLTSDLFLSVQGGITIERDSLGNRFITMRSNTFRSSRCLPAIFVDGMSLRGLTTADIDGLVRPNELVGVEVYRAANAPVEFSEQDGCGTILLWTKR